MGRYFKRRYPQAPGTSPSEFAGISQGKIRQHVSGVRMLMLSL